MEFHKKKNEKPRLEKVQTRDYEILEKTVITIGIILGIILFLLLFVVICMCIIPQTHGFYWY